MTTSLALEIVINIIGICIQCINCSVERLVRICSCRDLGCPERVLALYRFWPTRAITSADAIRVCTSRIPGSVSKAVVPT